MTQYLFATGLSGAGRSSAAATLEDLGWFVIDNLPPWLIDKVMELSAQRGSEQEKFCFVLGRGGAETTSEIIPSIKSLREKNYDLKVLFLDASDEVLVQRYEGTRRRHPLEAEGLLEAIMAEREVMNNIKEIADIVIDTSNLNVHELRDQLVKLFANTENGSRMELSVVSFGYKYGLPLDCDIVLDCRFLPNPHWVEGLRYHTGLEDAVRDYVLSGEDAQELLVRLDELFAFLLPAYTKEGKSYLSIGIGCTGGKHRSVVIADELSKKIIDRGFPVMLRHRDVEK